MKLATGKPAPRELIDLLQPGQRVKVYAGEDRYMNGLYHILAVVDENQIVYKVWGKHKQRWFYKVEDVYMFFGFWKEGWLSKG